MSFKASLVGRQTLNQMHDTMEMYLAFQKKADEGGDDETGMSESEEF